MFGNKQQKIYLDRDLYDRLAQVAQSAGYSSTEEFIIHVLETTAPSSDDENSEEEVRKRLQGLGYLE